MADFYPFIIAGLVSGSVYGLTATGLVLTYTTSGIFNIAHGALAASGAYAFYQLRTEWGLPTPVAFVVAVLVVGPLMGLALERLATWTSGATTAVTVVVTVGLLTAVQGLLTAVYGATVRPMDPFLPSDVLTVGSVNVGVDQILVFVIAVVGVTALSLYLRRSRTGTAMRGVVDAPDLLDLAGTSPTQVRRLAWAIGCSFAVLSGVLLAPTIGLDPVLLPLLAVQAFGAAAVGRFTSLPRTFVGGLGLGVVAALSTKYVSDVPALSGFPASLPFIVLFAVLVLTRRGALVELGDVAVARRRRGGPWTRSRSASTTRGGLAALVCLAALVPSTVGPRLPVFTTAVIFVLLFASLRLLVATSAQVSLCHVAFAAVGATSFSHLTTGVGVPWFAALLLAGFVAAPVGAVVALPAIRLSGLYLALATFGFGILVDRLVYPMGLMFGADGLAFVPRPDLGFVDADSDSAYYFVCLAVVAVGVLLIHLVNRSRLGRLLRSMADSSIALTTLGAGVTVTRVLVFCISAFLAGIAGALFAGLAGTTSGVSFSAFLSLSLIVILTVAGRREVLAPVVAAALLHILPSYLRSPVVNDYLPVLFGTSAILVSVLANESNGLVDRLRARFSTSARRRRATRASVRSGRPASEAPLAMETS